jgi:hypothetical protein
MKPDNLGSASRNEHQAAADVLSKIWGELLEIKEVDRQVNVFDLGVRSTDIILMISRARQAGFKVSISSATDSLDSGSGMFSSQEDAERIARLLQANADEDVLASEMVQVVNRRFFGGEIPRSITEEAKHTLQSFGEAVFPWRYLAARRSQKRIMTHCARRLPKDVHVLDVAHNIGKVAQTAAGALRTLKANAGKPIEEIFTSHAPTPQVPRIAVRSSKLDGLLLFPTRAGQTVIMFEIGRAADKTKDLLFTFGTGRSQRPQTLNELRSIDHGPPGPFGA